MTQIDEIMGTDNEVKEEAAFIELDLALEYMTVNDAGYFYCYFHATTFNVGQNKAPILDYGASTTFVTSDDYLTNSRKQKTTITTANGKSSFTQ